MSTDELLKELQKHDDLFADYMEYVSMSEHSVLGLQQAGTPHVSIHFTIAPVDNVS